MQIMVFALVLIAIIVFIIYKINNKFGIKEFAILGAVILVSALVSIMLIRNDKEKVPNLFKQKYEKEKKVSMYKLSYERLNNRNISSNRDFIYDFDYIIKKDGIEFVCSSKNVKIKKIEDIFVFEDFKNLNEKCKKR